MHVMEQAMLDALVLTFENDPDAEKILRLALPHFIQFHDREMDDLDLQWKAEHERDYD